MFLNGIKKNLLKSTLQFDVIALKNKPKLKGKLSLGSRSMTSGGKFILPRRLFFQRVFRGGHPQIQL
jgi:hypothetical protein